MPRCKVTHFHITAWSLFDKFLKPHWGRNIGCNRGGEVVSPISKLIYQYNIETEVFVKEGLRLAVRFGLHLC